MASLAGSVERYSDPKAAQEYLENNGVEVSGSAIVDASSGEAFDTWLRVIWLADSSELERGVGRGLVGHTRRLPVGVTERIVSAGLPSDTNDCVASVCYKLIEGGRFLTVPGTHIGLISFVPVKEHDSDDGLAQSRKTLVVWRIKTTATTVGNIICGGAPVRLMLRSVIRSTMQTLQREVTKKEDGDHSQ